LAFLAAAHRFFVAATIRARPSGLRRRFFPGGLRGHPSRRRLWFPGSRPAFSLRGGYPPARGGAHDALRALHRANAPVLSNPAACDETRLRPQAGSAAIRASYG